MNISRDKQDFWSKVWQQKLCDFRISRGRFFAPYFGDQKLDLYAEKYGKKMVGSYMVGCSNLFVEYDIIIIAFLISV